MTTDICYVISHGFAARMLLQTGLIRRLADSGRTVAIITPDPEDENLAAFGHHPRVKVYGSRSSISIWDDDYLFRRKYFLEDVTTNTALWEKHVYSLYYSSSLHPWRRIRPIWYYLIYKLIRFFPGIRQRFIRKEHQHLRSKQVHELIRRIDPRLVVATYPVNILEAQVLFAAREQGIETLIHLLSWDNITTKGRFPVSADRYIVWGEVMYQELQEHYQTPQEHIHICGVPHFDHHIRVKEDPAYENLVRALGLRPDRPYLFFAMSSPRFAPREIDIVEWLAGKVNDNSLGPDVQLIVRPHPQNVQGSMADTSWLSRLHALQGERVAVDMPQLVDSQLRWSMRSADMDRLSNLLAGSTVCLNSGSTVSIDALMLDKPVILTSFDGDDQLSYWRSARRLIDYPHLSKFVAMGGATVVRSYEELKTQILTYVQDPDFEKEKRRHALLQECYRTDGRSTERVLKAMDEILESIYSTA